MQLWAEGHHGWQESHTETAVIETKEIASLLKANNPQDRRGAMQCLRMMLDLYISVYMPYIDPYLNQKDMSDARVVGRTRKMEERLNSDKENIMNSVESLSSISEENAASTQETSASLMQLDTNMESVVEQAKDLQKIAEELTANVKYFKVELPAEEE